MKAGAKQRLVDINIAESGHHRLVQQNRLQPRGTASEPLAEGVGGEGRLERFGSEPGIEPPDLLRRDEENATELSLIGKSQLPIVGEHDGQMLEAERGIVAGGELQGPGHPKVDQERAVVVEVEAEVFPPPDQIDDAAADDRGARDIRTERPDDPDKLADSEVDDRPIADAVEKGASDSFDFGEFWHTGRSMERRT